MQETCFDEYANKQQRRWDEDTPSLDGALQQEMLKHAMSEALVSLRKEVNIAGGNAICCLSGHSWWPTCESDYRKMGVKYDALLGVWHTDIGPRVGRVLLELDEPGTTATDAVRRLTQTHGRTVYTFSEGATLGSLDANERPSAILVERYQRVMEATAVEFDESMRQWRWEWVDGQDVSERRQRQELWGVLITDNFYENMAHRRDETQILDALQRALQARMVTVQSLAPVLEVCPAAVFIRPCPFNPTSIVELFVLLRVQVAEGLDRALTVENLADADMAAELHKRIQHASNLVAGVPGWTLDPDLTLQDMCLHNVVRWERASTCPWCSMLMPPLLNPKKMHLKNEEREHELMQQQLEDEAQDVSHRYRSTCDGEEALDALVERFSWLAEEPPELHEQILHELREEGQLLLNKWEDKPQEQLVDPHDLNSEATWGMLRDNLWFWMNVAFPAMLRRPAQRADPGCRSGS